MGGGWVATEQTRLRENVGLFHWKWRFARGKMNFGHFKGILTRNCVDTKPAELMISLSRLVSLRSGRTKLNARSQSLQ